MQGYCLCVPSLIKGRKRTRLEVEVALQVGLACLTVYSSYQHRQVSITIALKRTQPIFLLSKGSWAFHTQRCSSLTMNLQTSAR